MGIGRQIPCKTEILLGHEVRVGRMSCVENKDERLTRSSLKLEANLRQGGKMIKAYRVT